MIQALRAGLLLSALVVGSQAVAAETLAKSSLYVTGNISVTGAVEHPLTLRVEDLHKLAPQLIVERSLTHQSGANAGKEEHLKGVLLRGILEKAGIVVHDHNDAKKMAIIAIAKDGYAAVFSWNELFNTSIGDGVIVFFEKDGKPLADDEGRIAMVSTKDTRTGPRHVKWLESIEIRKLVE